MNFHDALITEEHLKMTLTVVFSAQLWGVMWAFSVSLAPKPHLGALEG
jgi:hypothetical protein